jgi:gamma-glutamylputrescine oxidase
MTPRFSPLTMDDLEEVISFMDIWSGKNYYQKTELISIIKRSLGASFVARVGDEFAGVRLTHAPGNWLEEYTQVSPSKWKIQKDEIAYFKSLFVSSDFQKMGIGKTLSSKSIEVLKALGAKGILCHSWLESPANSSQIYLKKLGFESVAEHKKFWFEMSVSFWQDSGSTNKIQKDIVIIGGGLAGLSAAYWLQQEDLSLEIAVVEKYEIGSGASGRNAGFITCGSVEHFNRLVSKHGREEALAIWGFSETNLKLLKEHIIKGSEDDLLFEHQGSFSLASTDTEFKELQASTELMNSFNINVERVDLSDIKLRLGAEGFVGGIKYIDDATVHPLKMLQTIRTKIEKIGNNVEFFENHEVAKIFTTRGQILITEKVPPFMEAACYANFVLDYFRQLPTGELLIGGFRQLQKDVETGYSDQTTETIQKALEELLQIHNPAVREAKITHRWSGIMGFSVDGQPMVGALPTDPQLYLVGGFTAHGLGLAFNAGKTLVDAMFDRAVPAWISAKRLG